MAAYERAAERGIYGDEEYLEPPRRMDADILMMFIAARQLLRALKQFDVNYRVHEGVDRERVRQLRNALEHWDEEEGESIAKLRAAKVDPKSNTWRRDGSGIVGDVDDRDLGTWAKGVYDDIKRWDPYDEKWLKDHGYPTGVVLSRGKSFSRQALANGLLGSGSRGCPVPRQSRTRWFTNSTPCSVRTYSSGPCRTPEIRTPPCCCTFSSNPSRSRYISSKSIARSNRAPTLPGGA
jgi:hypothetical protein